MLKAKASALISMEIAAINFEQASLYLVKVRLCLWLLFKVSSTVVVKYDSIHLHHQYWN